MNYYYDILLNFKEVYYLFYEWNKNDQIEFYKKIPLFRVNENVFKDFYKNIVKVDQLLLKEIYNKSKLKGGKLKKYSCIFSDGKNSIGILFNNEGVIIKKSSLILEDELNIHEIMFSIDEYNINYEILRKEDIRLYTRIDNDIKNTLIYEINKIYNNKEYSKLKYIYLKWFNKLDNDIEYIYKEMINKMNDELTNKEYEIYDFIKYMYNA